MASRQEGDDLVIQFKDGAAVVEDSGSHDIERTASRTAALAIDPGRRAAIEKRLKLKLDARNSIFLLVYIMNYLSVSYSA